MSLQITSISATNMIPLSATYRYDQHIDMKPMLYNYDSGYAFFHHPVFEHTKDTRFAQDSFFALTSANQLHNLLDDVVNVDPMQLVLFTSLIAGNGKYITNSNNTLYASATSVSSSEFFRLIKNDDGSHSISQGELYATLVTTNNDFSIKMQDKIEDDINNIQKFYFYTGKTSNTITIRMKFLMSDWMDGINNLQTTPLERFVSYSDVLFNNPIKVIGMVNDINKYVDENNYTFMVNVDTQNFPIGFDGKVIWVKYYTEFLSKFMNNSVDVEDTASDLQQNYLIEYPYKSEIDISDLNAGTMNVNIISLKNTMTPEYNYQIKTTPLSA